MRYKELVIGNRWGSVDSTTTIWSPNRKAVGWSLIQSLILVSESTFSRLFKVPRRFLPDVGPLYYYFSARDRNSPLIKESHHNRKLKVNTFSCTCWYITDCTLCTTLCAREQLVSRDGKLFLNDTARNLKRNFVCNVGFHSKCLGISRDFDPFVN